MLLLICWLAATLAAVVYCEAHPGHRFRKLFVLGSVFVAVFIGRVEGSGVDSIILTNIPWCLSLGMLLDFFVHNSIRVLSNGTAERRISVQEEPCCGTEKMESV